jgi:hypothetical protein
LRDGRAEDRFAPLAAVDKELAAAGLPDPKTGEVTEEAKRLYGWERTIALATPGVMVKGYRDECATCEPNLDGRSSSIWCASNWKSRRNIAAARPMKKSPTPNICSALL